MKNYKSLKAGFTLINIMVIRAINGLLARANSISGPCPHAERRMDDWKQTQRAHVMS